MGEDARRFSRVFGLVVFSLLLVACGGAAEAPVSGAGSAPGPRYGVGSPVETEAAAIGAVRAHLFHIISCQAARDRVERDLDAGKFAARQVFAYQARNPVWEVAVATDMHIPYLTWFVEQGDGAVLASISAATYYESPLLHMCRQIYAATSGDKE